MHAPLRSVLLVHPDSARRAALAEAFRSARVVTAPSREGLARQLNDEALDLVLAHHGEARGLMRDLDRASHTSPRMLLGRMSDPRSLDALAEIAAEGHQFFPLDDDLPPPLLERQVQAFLDGRRSGRAQLALPHVAHFCAGGQRFELPCLDIGNRGFSVEIDARSRIECLLAGTLVTEISVRGASREVLRAAVGRVRHLRPQGGDQERFRVGIELVSAEEQQNGARLSDPIRVLASLRRALRRGEPLRLQLAESPERSLVTREATIELGEGGAREASLIAPNTPPLLATRGDVVRLTFELGGHSYAALTTALATRAGSVELRLPRSLTPQHRRVYLRLPEGSGAGYGVRFRSASTGRQVTFPLLELHPHGCSFRYEPSKEVLPPGLALDELELVMPDGSTEPCEGVVRDTNAIGEADEFSPLRRCGVRLSALSPTARDGVIDSQLSARHPSLENGARAPFSDVWKVIRAADHFYPEYPLASGPHLEVLESVHQKLARAGQSLSRTLVHRDEQGEASGHIAGLRMYSRTWFIHHLAVAPGYHRSEQLSRQLSSIALDHIEHLEEVEFARMIWRTENRWSDRVCGGMAKAMGGSGLSVVRKYHYACRSLLPDATPLTSERIARRMRRADEVFLEAHLRQRGELLRIRAEELNVEEMELASAARMYATHDLQRGRTGFVVDGRDGPIAMALAEHATPGLDWPEITNAFTLFVTQPSHPEADAARRALILRCMDHYREMGRRVAICVADDKDLPALRECGFNADAGEVAEWTFHRQGVRTCHDLLQLIFERLARPARARKTETH